MNQSPEQDSVIVQSDQTGQQAGQSLVTTGQPGMAVAGVQREQVGIVQLLEERPVVQIETQSLGQVSFRKELRTRTVQVPVELTSEVLVIERKPATGAGAGTAGQTLVDQPVSTLSQIMIDGQPLTEGQVIEITLTDQIPQIGRQVVLVEEVDIYRQARQQQQTVTVELQHEELVWRNSGDLESDTRTTPQSQPVSPE